jgi:hypothetical protein
VTYLTYFSPVLRCETPRGQLHTIPAWVRHHPARFASERTCGHTWDVYKRDRRGSGHSARSVCRVHVARVAQGRARGVARRAQGSDTAAQPVYERSIASTVGTYRRRDWCNSLRKILHFLQWIWTIVYFVFQLFIFIVRTLVKQSLVKERFCASWPYGRSAIFLSA